MSETEDILARVNRDALLKLASSWAGGLPCQLDDRPPVIAVGYVLLLVVFPSSGKRWLARIPFDQDDSFVEFCVRPLEYLAHHHSHVPAPRIHGYVDGGSGSDRDVGVAFMMMDWIPGETMNPWDPLDPPAAAKDKLLHFIADFMLDMIAKPAVKGDILFYGKASTFIPHGWCRDLTIRRGPRRHCRRRAGHNHSVAYGKRRPRSPSNDTPREPQSRDRLPHATSDGPSVRCVGT